MNVNICGFWDALFGTPCFMVYAGRAWCGLEFTPRLDVTDSPCAMLVWSLLVYCIVGRYYTRGVPAPNAVCPTPEFPETHLDSFQGWPVPYLELILHFTLKLFNVLDQGKLQLVLF